MKWTGLLLLLHHIVKSEQEIFAFVEHASANEEIRWSAPLAVEIFHGSALEGQVIIVDLGAANEGRKGLFKFLYSKSIFGHLFLLKS